MYTIHANLIMIAMTTSIVLNSIVISSTFKEKRRHSDHGDNCFKISLAQLNKKIKTTF